MTLGMNSHDACPGWSRAGNPCARTPGRSGTCSHHTGLLAPAPSVGAPSWLAASPAPSDPAGADPAHLERSAPAGALAPTNPHLSFSDHAHEYGFNGVCTITGCGRARPAWLITATPEPAKVALNGRTKTSRTILLGVVSLALTGALGHVVGSSLTDRMSGTHGTGTYLDLPPGVR